MTIYGYSFTVTEIVLVTTCVVLILLPPKWDPATRIREWQVRTGRHPESPNKD